MKTKNLIMGLLCLFVLVIVFSLPTKSQKPEETPLFEPILIGTGGSPHWSPDGTKLASMYKGSLYIANADGTGERLKVAELPKWTLGFIWADSTEFIFWEWERQRIKGKGREITARIKKLTIDGKIEPIVEERAAQGRPRITVPIVLSDGTVGYYENPESPNKTFKIIKQGKLPPDSTLRQIRAIEHNPGIFTPQGQLYPEGGIGLESVDGTIKKEICKGKFYSSPQLSPDGSKILVANFHGPDYGIFVLSLEGKPLAYLGGGVEDSIQLKPDVFGYLDGSTAKWSPDSKQIVYLAYAQDEYNIIASELLIVNADGSERKQITYTPDEEKGGASWSPDGTRIAYGRDWKIYVIKVK